MSPSRGRYILEYESGRSFHTFAPAPLQNISRIDIDNQMLSQLVKAHSLLGKLDGMFFSIPHIDILRFPLARYEAICSVEIEKRELLYNERYGAEPYAIPDEKMIASYADLLLQGKALLSNKATLLDNIRNCHRLILNDDCYEAGQFRTTQLFTYPKAVAIGGHPYYNPPNPDEVMMALDDLGKYMNPNVPCEFDSVVQIALVYYQLATIRPFLYGNGLAERVYINLLLMYSGVLSYPLLCMSDYLLGSDVMYRDTLSLVRDNFKGYEAWLKFFLKVLIASADKTIKMLDEIHRLRATDLGKIRNYERCSPLLLVFYDYLWTTHVVEARNMVSILDVSYNTVAKAVDTLRSLDILKQADAKTRYRRFEYRRLLSIFREQQ